MAPWHSAASSGKTADSYSSSRRDQTLPTCGSIPELQRGEPLDLQPVSVDVLGTVAS